MCRRATLSNDELSEEVLVNQTNETIVSPEMMKTLQEMGLGGGYEPVPEKLLADAEKRLGQRAIASMDPEFKRKIRNHRKRMRREGVPGF